MKVPLALAAALFLTAGGCVAAIKVRQPDAGKRPPVTLKSVFSGLDFVWHRSIILGVISLDLFAVLLGGVTALLPIFARDISTPALGRLGCCGRRRRWALWACPRCWRIGRWGTGSG